jgi:hypothetical protein
MSDDISPTDLAEQAGAMLRQRLWGRVRQLTVVIHNGTVILRGQAFSYHAKQLAQHMAMKEIKLPILANEIEVKLLDEDAESWY